MSRETQNLPLIGTSDRHSTKDPLSPERDDEVVLAFRDNQGDFEIEIRFPEKTSIYTGVEGFCLFYHMESRHYDVMLVPGDEVAPVIEHGVFKGIRVNGQLRTGYFYQKNPSYNDFQDTQLRSVWNDCILLDSGDKTDIHCVINRLQVTRTMLSAELLWKVILTQPAPLRNHKDILSKWIDPTGSLTISTIRGDVLEDMLPLSEKQSISWPVSEHFVQEAQRSLVSFWSAGKPGDVSVSCQVVGTEPTYGFPRVCNQTASIRVIQEHIQDAFDRLRNRRHQTTTPIPEEEKGKVIIELRGKCFNATLTVQKHTERCPWCPDPAEITVIGQELPEDSALTSSILSQLQGEDRLVHVGIAAAVAVLTSAAFACLLVAFMRQKKSHRQISVKPRYQPYSPALAKITDDESRYDLPWETHPQQRNLAYWQTRSESTTTSPLDSASSLGRFNYRIFGVIPPPPPSQTSLYQHISPNSSLGAHDSGLDSV